MIIFIYGEDSYRSRRKLNELIEEYKKKNPNTLRLSFFDCEEENISLGDLQDQVRQYLMFKEKKLMVIINLFSSVKLKNDFAKKINSFLNSSDIIIVYEANSVKASDLLLKSLKQSAKYQECKNLTRSQLKSWAKEEFNNFKVFIDSQALDLLLDWIGEDLWWLSNEIQKLANYKKGKNITIADVKLLVKPKIETDIFKTIDAIAQKNKKQALNLLYQHLENGDSPLYLLSMIGYQFRNLLIVKELIEKNKPYSLIIKKSGLHPFVVQKSYFQSRQFSFSELKKIYQKIFQVDFDVKTGKIEQETALDLLVAGI